MGLLSWLRAGAPAAQPQAAVPVADGPWMDLADPRLAEFLRGGLQTASGAVVGPLAALRTTAVFRCVDLISSTMGMLPLYLLRKGADGSLAKAEDHPLFDLLLHEPNDWQSGFDFRALMQMRALLEGDSFALVVRSRGQVMRLVPLDDVSVTQNADWTLTYRATRPDGGQVTLGPSDVLHLRGLSYDGIFGLARTRMAREAIGLAMRTEEAAARLFNNGQLVGGVLTHPGKLSAQAAASLRESMENRYAGAENAGRWIVAEEGMKAERLENSAKDNQHMETRKHQIEEIARVFGVPRPLLMIDETSWGSGIEQLGTLFVRYGLAPWFVAWEQAIRRTLLTTAEKRTLRADFDEQELLRGSMKDQGTFFAQALGAGGHAPWMTQNEVREVTGFARHADGDSLKNPMTTKAGAGLGENNGSEVGRP